MSRNHSMGVAQAATRRSPRIEGIRFGLNMRIPQMISALEQNANAKNNNNSNNENLNEAQKISKRLHKALRNKQRKEQEFMNELGNLTGLLSGLKVHPQPKKSAGAGKHHSRTAQLKTETPKKSRSKAAAKAPAAKPVRTKQQTLTSIKGILQKNEVKLMLLSPKQINMMKSYIQNHPLSLSNFTNPELNKLRFIRVI